MAVGFEYEHLGITKKYFQDFGPLTITDRKIPDLSVGIDEKTVCFRDLLKFPACLFIVQEKTFLESEDEVFNNG